MDVYETEVPGVGYKYELPVDGDERLVVIVHHDGKRDVYRRPGPDADSEKLLTLTGEQARTLGAVLEGGYFQPLELDATRVPLDGAVMEWFDLDDGAALVGQTLAAAGIRQETGASVIAIQRGSDTLSNPEPGTTFRAGDVLVLLGTREQLAEFEATYLD